MQFIYKIIYHRTVNYILRNINYVMRYIFKNIKIPPSGILRLKTDSGTIHIATNQTSYLTQLLFWKGYKKFEYSELFEDLCKDIGTFLDIGSNIGYYSLLAAKSNPSIKTYAFEPAHGPKHFLNRNIDINNLNDNITSIDLALSDSFGEIDFYEVKSLKYKYLNYNLAGEGNAGTKKYSRNFIKNTVKSETLDNFVCLNKINEIDLIKIDTEGTEVDILKHGFEAISKFQPIVICETLYDTIETELEVFFKKLDYEFYNHTEIGLIKVSTIQRTYDDGIRNCFFVPKTKSHLISSFVSK